MALLRRGSAVRELGSNHAACSFIPQRRFMSRLCSALFPFWGPWPCRSDVGSLVLFFLGLRIFLKIEGDRRFFTASPFGDGLVLGILVFASHGLAPVPSAPFPGGARANQGASLDSIRSDVPDVRKFDWPRPLPIERLHHVNFSFPR